MESVPPLFACLRAPRPTPAVVDIARTFSPRLQRHGPGCVVCDVSGLGRLLGEPAAIGAELAAAASAAGRPMRIAVAPTMTAGLLLTLAGDELSVVTGDPAAAVAAVRKRIAGLETDRHLAPDLAAAEQLVLDGSLVEAVEQKAGVLAV